jgi:uncharacterized protein (TIGR03435 family)
MKKLAGILLLVFAAHFFSPELRGQTPEAFEVASVKPAGEALAAAMAAFGAGCDGGFPRVDHNRFAATTTLYALMTWAYGFNKNGGCSFVSYGDFISGGPAWIKSDRFEIQALMPAGTPEYTTWQFLNGEAPALEVMIKNLLADRFHLTIHRETKQVSGYELVLGKGGAKVSASTDTNGTGLGSRIEKKPDGTVSQHFGARKLSMTYVALMFGVLTRRPVVDRTGLTGEFTFDLEFAPSDPSLGESSAASLFTAVQEQLGLKLESARVPAEVLIIDRAEKPSEN